MVNMMGKNTARNLSTKAAETKCLVPLYMEILAKYSANHPADLYWHYRGIGESIQGLDATMKDEGFIMVPAAVQAMFDHTTCMLRLWVSSGLDAKPKLRLLMHMCDRCVSQGNPAYYATGADETLNKILVSLGRAAHRSVWECRILTYFEQNPTQETEAMAFLRKSCIIFS